LKDLNFIYKELSGHLGKISPFGTEGPDIALVLGSGLGYFADKVNTIFSVSTAGLPGYPPSTIAGHEGKIHFAEYEGKKLLLFQGRIHPYEGYKIEECILPVWVSHKLHCKDIFLTNAAGGINFNFHPGDLMLILSFVGAAIKKELTSLIGLADVNSKNGLLDFPSPGLNRLLKQAALEEKIELKEGVYWYTKGPSYETPAEIRMMRIFGGDAVGMSTSHEALFASYLGMNVASVSCISNYAAGISPRKLSHAEVTETANLVSEKFENLVKRFITLL
jgi:purine-nucleoside phosphorylase